MALAELRHRKTVASQGAPNQRCTDMEWNQVDREEQEQIWMEDLVGLEMWNFSGLL